MEDGRLDIIAPGTEVEGPCATREKVCAFLLGAGDSGEDGVVLGVVHDGAHAHARGRGVALGDLLGATLEWSRGGRGGRMGGKRGA